MFVPPLLLLLSLRDLLSFRSTIVLLRGPKNAREAVRHFGPAPGTKDSTAKPYTRSSGRKFEMHAVPRHWASTYKRASAQAAVLLVRVCVLSLSAWVHAAYGRYCRNYTTLKKEKSISFLCAIRLLRGVVCAKNTKEQKHDEHK